MFYIDWLANRFEFDLLIAARRLKLLTVEDHLDLILLSEEVEGQMKLGAFRSVGTRCHIRPDAQRQCSGALHLRQVERQRGRPALAVIADVIAARIPWRRLDFV